MNNCNLRPCDTVLSMCCQLFSYFVNIVFAPLTVVHQARTVRDVSQGRVTVVTMYSSFTFS